jgi:hypothetical protein
VGEPQIIDKRLHDVFDTMADNWPSDIVARCKIAEFTGGMLSPKSMANYDSLGEGPGGRIKIGRKTGYAKYPLVEWLKKRAKLVSGT